MEDCYKCGFWNSDYGSCTCPPSDRWYACPIENKKPENQKELEEYAKSFELQESEVSDADSN